MKKVILTLVFAFVTTISFAQNIQKGTDKNGNLCLEKNGKIIVKKKFEKVSIYSKEAGLIAAKLNGKWGFYDNDGKLVIRHEYDLLFGPPNLDNWFVKERIEVGLNNKKFFIDKTGKKVVDEDEVFRQTRIFEENGKFGMNVNGKKVLKAKYEAIETIKEYGIGDKKIVAVKENGKWGFFNNQGENIIPIKYEDYNPDFFYDAWTHVKLNGKWGFIDKKGEEKIPFKYEQVKGFYKDGKYAAVQLNGKWGFIDRAGKEILPFKYEDATSFYEEGASVKIDDKWGMIDKIGKIIIQPKYDKSFIFLNNKAFVSLRGHTLVLDREGNESEPEPSPSNNSGDDNKPSNNSSTNNSTKKSDKCTYKCQDCNKITQGGCNSSSPGITKKNCPVRQPDPKGPRKDHTWRKQ